MASPGQSIVVQPMRHQDYLKLQQDDWAGVTDQKRRKTLQNRLNQRARKRAFLLKKLRLPVRASTTDEAEPQGRQRQPPEMMTEEASTADTVSEEASAADERWTANAVRRTRTQWERFAQEALQNYMANQLDAHHLLRVTKLNTINALTSNARALNIPGDWLMCRAISPLGSIGPAAATAVTRAGPPSLAPTDLQLRIPHHPWIDLLPLARMRDNWLMAIYVLGTLDEDEEVQLWDDLVEWQGGGAGTRGEMAAGLIVWGAPSDPRSWEVTVPFLRRWGRLLHGCDEILEATNYWRRSRGERCLIFKA